MSAVVEDRAVRILIVDDEPTIGRVMLNYLSKRNYLVEFVSSGLAALDSYARQRPDVVLADVMMPEMDGYELFEELKRRDPSVNLYFVTAQVESNVCPRANGVLHKPFGFSQLDALVASALIPNTPR